MGTAFDRQSVRRDATFKVLHDFTDSPDGALPFSGLTNVNGTLYGTTAEGGSNLNCFRGCGSVYAITPSGKETVIHSFQGAPDGSYPVAGLLNVNGILYGTTAEGGTGICPGSVLKGCGTVFAVNPKTGEESVLYSFKGWSDVEPDGELPYAGLTDVNGVLYGTTDVGGTGGCGIGCGTVFSITTSGTERVLHSFSQSPDGAYPCATLLNINGTLYGTTSVGGNSGDGAIFKITVRGDETILHAFSNTPDGAYPLYGSLIVLNGTIYGTTFEGGSEKEGTVFAVTSSGKESVLHSFDFTGGAYPDAGLINVSGKGFYGTTQFGGTGKNCGSYACGMVFAITPLSFSLG